VNVQCAPQKVQDCINSVGIGFLFAPLFHPAMKYAAKPRTELGVRTIFNILGPITNPAGVRKQLIGTYHATVAPKLADAMDRLATDKACVVHSNDGMDEVALSGETTVYEVEKQKPLRQYAVNSSSFNLPTQPLSALRGGTPADNAAIAQEVLSKQRGPARDVVLANAAFGIYVAGKARSLQEGSSMAAESIDSGRAMDKLKRMVEFTNQ